VVDADDEIVVCSVPLLNRMKAMKDDEMRILVHVRWTVYGDIRNTISLGNVQSMPLRRNA
jgi:hypothetical protein